MLECAKVQTRYLIDSIADDVELQAEEQMRLKTMDTQRFLNLQDSSELQSRGCLSRCIQSRFCCGFMRLRAFILYRVFPNDKTLWGCLRDPVWWFVILLSITTACGIRVLTFSLLLILLLVPCKPDEYHLTKYVTFIKATQVTSSCLGMVLGSLSYHYCIIFKKDMLLECIDTVSLLPFALFFCLLDYAGCFLLPHFAIAAFHWAVRLKPCRTSGQDLGETGSIKQPSSTTAEILQCCCCFHIKHPAPVRLRALVRYDCVNFIISLFLMVVLTVMTTKTAVNNLVCDPYLDERCKPDLTLVVNAYWCKVFYGLTAFPFSLIFLPEFTPTSFSLITRAARTGYNRDGICVLFKVRWTGPESSHGNDDSSSSDTDSIDSNGPSRTVSYHSSEMSDINEHVKRPSGPGFLGVDWRYLC